MSHILSIGIATLDIINSVAHYPAQDEEIRALEQNIRCGGNGANSARILAQFAHKVSFAGVLADDAAAQSIVCTLRQDAVDTQYCQQVSGTCSPTSYITLNRQNGSRTIIHYRDLPELDYRHFTKIPVEHMDWLHFEGRNIEATRHMLKHARSRCVDQTFSLEIEKERANIDSLLPLADLLFFSKTFVQGRGFSTAEPFFKAIRAQAPQALLVCAWGEQGAYAQAADTPVYHSPAYAPAQIVDTVGAGDTFNAGVIHALISAATLPEAIEYGCRLAGHKIGQQGIERLTQTGP